MVVRFLFSFSLLFLFFWFPNSFLLTFLVFFIFGGQVLYSEIICDFLLSELLMGGFGCFYFYLLCQLGLAIVFYIWDFSCFLSLGFLVFISLRNLKFASSRDFFLFSSILFLMFSFIFWFIMVSNNNVFFFGDFFLISSLRHILFFLKLQMFFTFLISFLFVTSSFLHLQDFLWI